MPHHSLLAQAAGPLYMIDFPCIAGYGAFVSLGDRAVQAHMFWKDLYFIACFGPLRLESYSLYKFGRFVSTGACISRSLPRLATSEHLFLCPRPSLQLFDTLGKKLTTKLRSHGSEASNFCRTTGLVCSRLQAVPRPSRQRTTHAISRVTSLLVMLGMAQTLDLYGPYFMASSACHGLLPGFSGGQHTFGKTSPWKAQQCILVGWGSCLILYLLSPCGCAKGALR